MAKEIKQNLLDKISSDILYNELIKRKFISKNTFTINDVVNENLSLDDKIEILDNVLGDETTIQQINYDIFVEIENKLK